MTQPKNEESPWTWPAVIALALQKCSVCGGVGLLDTQYRIDAKNMAVMWGEPCGCVLRNIFRICLKKYHSIDSLLFRRGGGIYKEKVASATNSSMHTHWVVRSAMYRADFCSTVRKAIARDDIPVLNSFFLDGRDWKYCCELLKMERGAFFHAVYRIEQTGGRALMEQKPYALYPLDSYLYGTTRATRDNKPSTAAEPTQVRRRFGSESIVNRETSEVVTYMQGRRAALTAVNSTSPRGRQLHLEVQRAREELKRRGVVLKDIERVA